jgi:hypothetical protein
MRQECLTLFTEAWKVICFIKNNEWADAYFQYASAQFLYKF